MELLEEGVRSERGDLGDEGEHLDPDLLGRFECSWELGTLLEALC